MGSAGSLVSIIITCFNQARFLAEAVQSCLNQTHRNIELIVVDDGSTDETASVAARFPQVFYISQENQGVSVARNTGLYRSRGPHLLFLDADDRLLPNAIEVGLDCFGLHPSAGFVVGRYRKIGPDGASINKPNRICGANDFYFALLQANVVGMHGAVLYSRTALEAVGGFDPRFRASEDYDIAMRIARDFQVQEHDTLVAEYRWHDGNMSWDHHFMLQETLDALEVQRLYAKTVPNYARAFRNGVSNWRRHYASLVLADLINEMKSGGLHPRLLHNLLSAVRMDPTLLPTIVRRTTSTTASMVAAWLRNP